MGASCIVNRLEVPLFVSTSRFLISIGSPKDFLNSTTSFFKICEENHALPLWYKIPQCIQVNSCLRTTFHTTVPQ